MAGRALLASLVVVLAGGCVQSEATPCGDVICPAGRACSPADPPTCVDENLIAACDGRAEGEVCTVAGGRPGVCTAGLCLLGACGDGRINGDNQCDGADLGGATCLDFGSAEPDGLLCVDCQFDPSECVSRCGDGIKNGLEGCDGTDFGDLTCLNLGFYAPDGLTCNAAGDEACTVNPAGCQGGFCGDGTLNGFEVCDGAAMADTCLSLGYVGPVAPLRCADGCQYDPSSCLCGGFLCAVGTQQCVDLGEGNLACQPCPEGGC